MADAYTVDAASTRGEEADYHSTRPAAQMLGRRLGRRIERAEQQIDAVAADAVAAELLGVKRGSPMIRARRTYFATGDQPIQFLAVRYHPERYRFIVDLLPRSGSSAFEGACGPGCNSARRTARWRGAKQGRQVMKLVPIGKTLGATIEGADLSQPLTDADFAALLRGLGEFGVLCFPRQSIDAPALKRFSERFGSLQVSLTGEFTDPQTPEVMILSNVVENGKPIGLADAGQDWHTDMSYNRLIGFTNVLYGIRIPRRDGKALGNTAFANMHAAYDELPDQLQQRLEGMTASHDFNKFWEEMRRRPGSTRPALTPEQRAKRPPAIHPVFMTHPITGRKVLYCNPGYATRINEMDEAGKRAHHRAAICAPAPAEIPVRP